jgi:HAE1 family hydrophobic/amphiphilic exporter-1
VQVSAPERISFAAMNDMVLQVENDLRKLPQVVTTLATVGGNFVGGVNSGEIYVRVPPHDGRYFSFGRFFKGLLKAKPQEAFQGNYTQTDVMQAVRAALRKYQREGVRVSVRNYPGFNIGGGNFDIDFSVSGPDLVTLADLTKELVERGEKIGGIVNLDTTLKLDKPELRVTPDRERAADLRVSSADIGTALRLMVGGDEEVSQYRDEKTNENYDVRLRLQGADRASPTDVPRLLLGTTDGRLVELSNIVSTRERAGGRPHRSIVAGPRRPRAGHGRPWLLAR